MSVSRRLDFLDKAYQAHLSAQQAVQAVIDEFPRGESLTKLEIVDTRLDEVGVLLFEVIGELGE